jgi:hypothetical protein
MKASHLSIGMRAGEQFAHVTLELPLAELPEALEEIDCSELDENLLQHALDASAECRRQAPAKSEEE